MASKKDRLSVFISLILRHKPESIGVKMDPHGYVDVSDLIKGINDSGRVINMNILEEIVESDNKGRYSFNGDKTKIRANQGHSIKVDVGLKEAQPPKYLYHGTSRENLESIMSSGIKKMNRLHVHLSEDVATATQVGGRHGAPVILKIDTQKMIEDEKVFYLSENSVWLTDYIDPSYIKCVQSGK